MEEKNEMIVLTAEDGTAYEFEVLDAIQENGKTYAFLASDNPELDFIIVEVTDRPNEDKADYNIITDQEELDRLFEIFKAKNPDAYDYE